MAAKGKNTWAPTIPSDLKYLILHESPAEVKAVQKFLPKGYMAMATVGHFLRTSPKELDIDIPTWTPNFKVDPGKKNVVANIQKAIDVIRKNNGKVILCGDMDREGETINHLVVQHFKLKSNEYIAHKDPSSLIEKEYMKGILNPRDSYNKTMAEAGITRQILDKYIGFKVTEHLWGISSKYKPFLDNIQKSIAERVQKFEEVNGEILKNNPNIKKIIDSYKDINWKLLDEFDNRKGISFGRVQTVSLILLVNKELEKFDKDLDRKLNIIALDSKFQWEYSKNAELETDVNKMTEIYKRINDAFVDKKIKSIKVIDIQSSVKKVSPPHTLDTISAQIGIGNQFGMSVKRVMDALQHTYEAQKTSYMRTDTNATTEAYEEYIEEMIKNNTNQEFIYREYPLKKATKKKDDKAGDEITSQDGHIGILPTKAFDLNNLKDEVSSLNEDEQKVFEYVVRRTVAAFMPEAKVEYFNYILEVEGEGWKEEFILKDTNIIEEGFLEVFIYAKEKYEKKVFYSLDENIDITEFILREKDIKLPGGYTETSFIKELKENGIGRPSTWKEILEMLKSKSYIKMVGSKIEVTPKGLWVYQVITQDEKTFGNFSKVGYTAAMEKGLDKVAKGDYKREVILNKIKAEIDNFEGRVEKSVGGGGESLGDCPICKKGEIKENAKAWGCTNWKGGCKFTIWKTVSGHNITEEEKDYMIKHQKTDGPLEMVSKAGKTFNASLIFDKRKGFQFSFDN